MVVFRLKAGINCASKENLIGIKISPKRHTVRRELDNVAVWASRNNLRLNPNKSREMIIAHKGNADPPKTDMERVFSMKILGMLVSNDLHSPTTLKA